MFSLAKPGRWLTAGMLAATILIFAFFWHSSTRDSRIFFLENHSPADWIVYPKPVSAMQYVSANLSTEFRKSISLDSVPLKATLSVRAMERFAVRINGKDIAPPADTVTNWKDVSMMDVQSALRVGTNEISVTVHTSNGLPALWLTLDAGRIYSSDKTWTASMMGAAWRDARLASEHPNFEPGNPLHGGAQPLPSFKKNWSNYLIFSLLSLVAVVKGRTWLAKHPEFNDPSAQNTSKRFVTLGFRIVGALWLVLFLNNASQLYPWVGFDASAHLEYINFIKTHWRVPLATEGWEMYQPPLYYMLTAIPAVVIQTHGFSADSLEALRLCGMVIGLVRVVFVFLGLRLLFPKRLDLQLFGLIFSAMLPVNFYISHYISNEGLCGTLGAAALYFSLRILKRDERWRMYFWLGLCLGLALLAKVTAFILVPLIAVVLIHRNLSRKTAESFTGPGKVAFSLAVVLVTCGWYYLNVWKHLGTPLPGNWTGILGFNWWLENSYETASYFFRFGRCLTQPWYSGFHSFGDGLYSTLWGDGCLGGSTTISDRPPWNDGLMAAGFWLALFPTALILFGAFKAIWRLCKNPDSNWFLMISVAFATLAATIHMTLKLPAYAQVKSFYGLIAMLPLCAFATLGWETLLRRGRWAVSAATVLFGVWAMNSYCSFWIRSWNPDVQEIIGRGLLQQGERKVASEFYEHAFQHSPGDLKLRKSMAFTLANSGKVAEAKRMLDSVLQEAPDFMEARVMLVQLLSAEHLNEQALAETEQLIRRAPDSTIGYTLQTALLMNQPAKVAMVGREGLRVNPTDLTLQQRTADAFAQIGDQTNAAVHLRAIEILKSAKAPLK